MGKLVHALPSGHHLRAAYSLYGTSQIGEWHLNHIHSLNHAEVINASLLDSSAEIDYRWARSRSLSKKRVYYQSPSKYHKNSNLMFYPLNATRMCTSNYEKPSQIKNDGGSTATTNQLF